MNILGYTITKNKSNECIDMEKEFLEIYAKCKPYTMTSIERMYSLYKATEYIVKAKIPGDVVECGVWRGGSAMLMAYTLLKMNDTGRKIWLYDTYSGMSMPCDKDVDIHKNQALKRYWDGNWCFSPLYDVQENLISTNYPKENLVFVIGKVEDTIPSAIPDRISLLRLDTDFYESTYYELYYLYPRLAIGGVIILDDYGHWKGAKEAVNKYFNEKNINILLNRIDYTGRIGIKQEVL